MRNLSATISENSTNIRYRAQKVRRHAESLDFRTMPYAANSACLAIASALDKIAHDLSLNGAIFAE